MQDSRATEERQARAARQTRRAAGSARARRTRATAPPSYAYHPLPPSSPNRIEMARRVAKRYGVPILAVLVLVLVSVLAFTAGPTAEDEGLSDEELAILAAQEMGSVPPPNAMSRVASAQPGAVTTGISVVTSPTGAEVSVEFDPVGTSPLDAYALDAGSYFISVSKEGYVPFDTLVFVDLDDINSVYLVLRSEGAFTGAAPGGLEVAPESETAAPARSPLPSPLATRQQPSPGPTPQSAPTRQPETRRTTPPSETVARPSPPPPPAVGELRIGSEPAGAAVLLDGRSVGKTPLALRDLSPGNYEVAFRKEGFVSMSERVTVRAGEQAAVRATLTQPKGEVTVLVRPWGSIYIDGELKRSDTDVQYSTSLPAGTHKVRVAHPSLGSQERTIEVRPGASERIVINLN